MSQSSTRLVTEEASAPRAPAAEIDASCRGPVLVLFYSSAKWLVLGLILALLASIKMHAPGFLADCAICTFGRLRPAAMNCLLYGFASQAGIGVMLWMMSRLGGTRLYFQGPILAAAAVWNIGVLIGIVGIFAGGSTGFEWLEMPRYASPILFLAYAVIGICLIAQFWMRREKSLYVSQWFLLAALFWFPWIYSAANLLLIFEPVRGTMQSVVNAWFTNNLLALWLTSIGLAAVFYFIPKLTGRPLYSQWLAALGFWTFAFFSNWSGMTPLIGGPVPLWITSASTGRKRRIVDSSDLRLRELAPDAARDGAQGHHDSSFHPLRRALLPDRRSTRRFSFPPACRNCLRADPRSVAKTYLALFGFVTMVLFGSIYFIVPRLTRTDWPSASWVRLHFFCTAGGTILIAGVLLIGGLIQGGRLNNPAVAFSDVFKAMVPFIGLSTVGWLVLLAGQILFFLNLCCLLRRYGEPFKAAAVQTVTGAGSAKAEASA